MTPDEKVQQMPAALRDRIGVISAAARELDAHVTTLAQRAIEVRNDFYAFESTLRDPNDDYDEEFEEAAGCAAAMAAFGAIALRAMAVHEGDRCSDWWVRDHGFHGLGIREASSV